MSDQRPSKDATPLLRPALGRLTGQSSGTSIQMLIFYGEKTLQLCRHYESGQNHARGRLCDVDVVDLLLNRMIKANP